MRADGEKVSCAHVGGFLLDVSKGLTSQAVDAATIWENRELVSATPKCLSKSAGAWHAEALAVTAGK